MNYTIYGSTEFITIHEDIHLDMETIPVTSAPPKKKQELIHKKVEVVADEIVPVDTEEVEFVEEINENIDANTEISDEPIAEINNIPKKEKVKAPAPPPLIEEEDEVFNMVPGMATFGECESLPTEEERRTCTGNALLEYVYTNLAYPVIARENGIEGRVVAEFVVDKNGKISKSNLLVDIGAGCGNEVIKLIDDLPDWNPGIQNGKSVSVLYRIPVSFKLQ